MNFREESIPLRPIGAMLETIQHSPKTKAKRALRLLSSAGIPFQTKRLRPFADSEDPHFLFSSHFFTMQ